MKRPWQIEVLPALENLVGTSEMTETILVFVQFLLQDSATLESLLLHPPKASFTALVFTVALEFFEVCEDSY